MPHSQHLHTGSLQPGDPREGYRWLSAPGAAAISLLLLHTSTHREIFGGALAGIANIPQRVWLKNSGTEVIDEAMACTCAEGLLLTLHGGPAVRRAVERELQRAGLAPMTIKHRGFARRALALLPQARGAAAVSMVLEAAGQADVLRATLDNPAGIPQILEETASARFLFEPPRIQLWGSVNAGKSSLLNALCGRPLAATGDEPGLTRDVIEGRVEHAGFELRLFDAPGNWADARGLDADAQQLARRWRDEADLVLELLAPGGRQQLQGSLAVNGKADKPEEEGVSIRRPETLSALKQRLVDHFFGRLRSLPPERRFAVDPTLRADLRELAGGAVTKESLAGTWFD
ncbi:MAG: 50S ribosome-binding GTPase [Planctomycetes bacterium]|nr:50S ribosome-binding GTPase [Planctomycetota bacterium]